MARCLLGLGSNLGDREATLNAALTAIDALPDVQLRKHSEWVRTRPVGGPAGQSEFLNGAALVDTTIAPLILLKELQQIEERLGRKPGERWAARPIDIDMLLYDREVMEMEMITLPHPRLTFRRFVLEPAAQIAPKMLHPIIGWPVERLLLHLDMANDFVAIVSPSEMHRRALAEAIVGEFAAAKQSEPPELGAAAQHWPAEWTTWIAFNPRSKRVGLSASLGSLPYAAATFPKLTILLDGDPAAQRAVLSKWSPIVRQPGRGPTLRLFPADAANVRAEAFAAVESIWPDLGPTSAHRLE
jgi:2-amino-4-hydroxy-6-hydroxymethyldihydropteridine diphosphokinase